MVGLKRRRDSFNGEIRKMSCYKNISTQFVVDIPWIERERELVGSCEAMTCDLLHPSQDFTLLQGPPQISHC